MTLLEQTVHKIPYEIRQVIREKNLIDLAVNNNARNTQMEYLFDVYVEFLDKSGDFGNYDCSKCRDHILKLFHQLKPVIYAENI